MTKAVLQRKCSCGGQGKAGGECEECKKKRTALQRKAASTASIGPSLAPPIVHDVLRSAGQPMDGATRGSMEQRFGHDFSKVRIHTDARAAESARVVRAQAYTVGRHVVFGRSGRDPGLLAHELAHVVQQAGSGDRIPARLPISDPSDSAEREAERAERLGGGTASFVPAEGVVHLQRKPTFDADCSEYHRCQVIEPLGFARTMIAAVLGALPPIASGTVTSGRIIDLLNVHFHTADPAHAQTILDRFGQIDTELAANFSVDCSPDDPADCQTDEGQVGAFTDCRPAGDVTLCTAYYARDCADQARLLIHEIAHHVPGMCTDHAYLHQPNYMTLPPAQSMVNPDTYSQFAKMVFRGPSTCKDCDFEVQIRPGQY